MSEQQHEMILEMTHPSGLQGWYCPTCDRRILLGVPPSGEMIIVEPGNHYVSHSGSTGGLRIGRVQVAQEKDHEIPEESLRPWIKALEDLDFDW